MIDSVQLNTSQRTYIVQKTYENQKKNDKAENLKTQNLIEPVKKKSIHDSTEISLDLQGNLETLQESVTLIQYRIRNQLEKYYGLTGQDAETIAKKFLPPEDSSAQSLMEFYSPHNTATRIVDFATGFLQSYLGNHKNRPDQENVEKFTLLITDAIQKGFEEAEKTLGGMKKLEKIGDGGIAKNIKKTYDLVMEGLNQFRIEFLKRSEVRSVDPEVVQEKEIQEKVVQENEQSIRVDINPATGESEPLHHFNSDNLNKF